MLQTPSYARRRRYLPVKTVAGGAGPAVFLRRMRFQVRGLWRALHPIPLDAPLPRPTHDY